MPSRLVPIYSASAVMLASVAAKIARRTAPLDVVLVRLSVLIAFGLLVGGALGALATFTLFHLF
jgi:hypothetical protein